MAESDVSLKPLSQLLGLRVQIAQLLIFDAILAAHLLDHQLTIAVDMDAVFRPQLQSMLKRADEGGVFGLVVGHLSQAAGFFEKRFTITANDVGVSGGPGIAARSAIGVNGQHAVFRHWYLPDPEQQTAGRTVAGGAPILGWAFRGRQPPLLIEQSGAPEEPPA